MKPSRLGVQHIAAALLTFAPLGAPLLAQTTATTTPVGFITVTVPAAANGTPSNKALSIPLYNPAAFTAAVTSVDSADSFTLTGANWTANQFTTAPHFVRIKTGANVGRFFLITSHTTSQLTVDNRGANLQTILAANDSCEIVPGNTLGSVFGISIPIVQSGATANVADNVFLWNGSTWDPYFHNGTSWRKAGNLSDQNNVVIYPDEGIFITRRAASPLELTFLGTVPSTTERTELAGSGSTFMANRFPVDIQLGNIGLHQSANWTAGATANVADNVSAWNGTTWETYFYNGTNWRKAGNLANQDTTVIPAGTAVFVKRAAASASTLTQNLPYTP